MNMTYKSNIDQTHYHRIYRDAQETRKNYNILEHLHDALCSDDESINNLLLFMKNTHQIAQFSLNYSSTYVKQANGPVIDAFFFNKIKNFTTRNDAINNF